MIAEAVTLKLAIFLNNFYSTPSQFVQDRFYDNKNYNRMKKWKDLNKNEKLIIIMLIISVILVISSWDRVSTKTANAFKYYFTSTSVSIINIVD